MAMKRLFGLWKRKDESSSLPSCLPTGQGYTLRARHLKKLHKAASDGDLEKLKEYLQHKKHDVNMRDKEDRWAKPKSLSEGQQWWDAGGTGPPSRNEWCLGSFTLVTLGFPGRRGGHVQGP